MAVVACALDASGEDVEKREFLPLLVPTEGRSLRVGSVSIAVSTDVTVLLWQFTTVAGTERGTRPDSAGSTRAMYTELYTVDYEQEHSGR